MTNSGAGGFASRPRHTKMNSTNYQQKVIACHARSAYNMDEVMNMQPNNIKYTAVLPVEYVESLKRMAKRKEIPSVNHGIRLAVGNYLKDEKKACYEQSMRQAAQDGDYMARTLETQEAFAAVDTEELGEW